MRHSTRIKKRSILAIRLKQKLVKKQANKQANTKTTKTYGLRWLTHNTQWPTHALARSCLSYLHVDGEDADHGFLDDQQLFVVLRVAMDQPDVAPGIAHKQEPDGYQIQTSSKHTEGKK